MDANVEREMCNNCKKEIPQPNYVMHTMHCARNITLCKVCNEPIPKIEYEIHREKCRKPVMPVMKPSTPPIALEKSSYFQQRKAVEDQKAAVRRQNYLKRHDHLIDNGFTLNERVRNGYGGGSSPSRFSQGLSSNTSSSSNLSSSSSTSSSGKLYSSPSSNYVSNQQKQNMGSTLYSSPSTNYVRNQQKQNMMGNILGSSPSTNYVSNHQQKQAVENNVSSSTSPPSNYSSNQQKTQVENNLSDSNSTGGGESRTEISSGVQGGAIKKAPLIPRLDEGSSGVKPKGPQGLLPCRYCDLELPKLDLEEHENYCGSRTDKCLECGELVMFKNKQAHLDSNHGSVKLRDEPSPRPTWDSSTHRTSSSDTETLPTRRRFQRLALGDIDYDPMPYLPAAYQPGGGLKKKKEGESYKEISRRLDCPAPQPPRYRRNPPTELTIPCEFCDTPIPHEDLIEHETGCRPDLARFTPRRSRSAIPLADEDDYTPYEAPRMRTPPRADSPDSEELPCEFCSHMVPASQLWRHQLSCTSAA